MQFRIPCIQGSARCDDQHLRGLSVDKFVEYFPERPEESSFLSLVNLIPILVGVVTLYLSITQRSANTRHHSWVLHFLMRGPNRRFPQIIMNSR